MKLKIKEDKPDYEYQIYVDKKLVWHGLNPKEKYEEIIKKSPGKKVSIGWRLKRGILVPTFEIPN